MVDTRVFVKCKVLLLDIEGTTTSIKFVKDVLFPYARDNLRKYIDDHWGNEELKEVVSLLRNQYRKDITSGYQVLAPIIESDEDEKESIIDNVLWQMDLDRKTQSLKKLQGLIWRDGFTSGKLIGHVYEDVVPALNQWVRNGLKLYIFSSGSIEAQKLHFGHSEKGNLLNLFSGHFDTSVGFKIEASSYSKIAEEICTAPEEILFITDVVAEADAAMEAGYKVVISERPGNAPILESYRHKYNFIQTFDQLYLT